MAQYGFFVDLSRCIGCNACVIACKQWHGIPPGPVKWMRVYQWEKGNFPDTRIFLLPIMCYHCERPLCVKACPHGALYKEESHGAVLVDRAKCRGERKCVLACPYGAPQFASDAASAPMSKCTMCLDRLQKGLAPICVLSCSLRALEFGLLKDLLKKYGPLRRMDFMPKEGLTRPAVVFKPPDEKKPVLPWNPDKALDLWKARETPPSPHLSPIFQDPREIREAPQEIVGRHRLVLKAKAVSELMYYTTDDE
jgi:anaerobic dimethyl sulfoxide reductase subunit B